MPCERHFFSSIKRFGDHKEALCMVLMAQAALQTWSLHLEELAVCDSFVRIAAIAGQCFRVPVLLWSFRRTTDLKMQARSGV